MTRLFAYASARGFARGLARAGAMERMSTRRGGERRGVRTEEKEKAHAVEDKPPPPAAVTSAAAAGAAAVPTPIAGAGSGTGAASAPASSAAAPASSAAPAAPAPRQKRAKVDTGEEPSWGEMPPPPISVIPQPLLPIRTVAGTGDPGFGDGPCYRASFRGPTGIAIGADGCLFVADADNRRLRKIASKVAPPPSAEDESGPEAGTRKATRAAAGGADQPVNFETVSTVAGSGHPGMREGRARDSTLCDPNGLAVDADGNVLLSDAGTHTIRRLSTTGEVSLLAGTGKPGFADGTGQQAAFEYP